MSYELPDSSRFLLLDVIEVLESNNPVAFSITNSAAPLDVAGTPYIPDPTLMFELPLYDGAVSNEVTAKVRMSSSYDLWHKVVSGRAHATLRLRMRELVVSPDGSEASYITLWIGDMLACEMDPPDQPGLVEVLVGRPGGRVHVEIGPEVTGQCWKRFGDPKNCGVNVQDLEPTGLAINTQITAIDRTAITCPGVEVTNRVKFYWQMGSVTRGDVRITIRSWSSGSQLHLIEYPPQDWIDYLTNVGPIPVVLRPGCRQILPDCQRYNNASRFGGIGSRIPKRNVLFELP